MSVGLSPSCPLCGGAGGRPFLRRPEITVLRCPCGFAFAAANTRPVPYEADYYAKWGGGGEALAAMKKRTYRGVLADVLGPGIRRVLDIGCAFGWSLDAAREAGLEAAGVEVSVYAAGLAARRHEVRASTSVYADESFDVVTLIDVIEHVRDPLGLLREARRLLRPGGWAVLTTPDLSSLSARILGPRWPYVISEHVVYFDRSTVRRALRKADLEPVRVGPFRKSLRADYVASVLGARGDALGRVGGRLARLLGGTEVGLCSGDMCVLARRPPAVTSA